MRGSRRRKVHEQFYMEIEQERAELIRTLGPPILAIILCLICLCGMTWAWFTANDEGTVAEIKSAHVLLDVTLVNNGSEDSKDKTRNDRQECSFDLSAQTEYTLAISKSNECSASEGYAEITISGDTYGSKTYRTSELISDSPGTYRLTIQAGEDVSVTVEGCWGSSSRDITDSGSTITVGDYSPPSDGEGDSVGDGAGGSSESGLSLGSDSTETSESEPAAKSAEAGESSQGEAHSGSGSESSGAEQNSSQGEAHSGSGSESSGAEQSNSQGAGSSDSQPAGSSSSDSASSGGSESGGAGAGSGSSSGSDSSSSSDSASS
jgi:hypothetical protein